MANTIITKNSSTASSVPTAGDLVQGELAVNVTDKRLFTENASGTVVELGTNPSTIDINAGTIDGTPIGASSASTGAFTTLSASGVTTLAGASVTSLTNSGATTLSGGTANGVPYLNGSKVLTSGSALTFDGSNLGLGVAPSAWDSSVFKALQVGATVSLIGSSSSSFGDVVSNGYYSTTGWKYITTNPAMRYRLDTSTGYHAWFTAPSGTAGTAISFTQAMTLNASGNVGIGTSSPGDKIELGGNGSGIIIRSPNGTRYRLTVTDLGVLSIAAA